LEARHRAHALVEDRIRCGKDTGFGRFPSRTFAINTVWLELALTGIDLIAFTQTLLLDGDLARQSRRGCATGCCTSPPASSAADDAPGYASPNTGPGHANSPMPSPGYSSCPAQ
jgi:hypothetical protein